MAIEMEQLTSRLVEAETRLKTEVIRIKKKFQIQITEMEMSLDVANKTNISLQQTIKKQSIQINVRNLSDVFLSFKVPQLKLNEKRA